MSATGLDVFDKTLQTTNTWLNEIMSDLGPDRHIAWHVLGAVLRTTRDRLPIGLAAHLGAELPLLVRGTYYDQFRPAEQPDVTRSLDEFLEESSKGSNSRDLSTLVTPPARCSVLFRNILIQGKRLRSVPPCR